MLVVQWEAREGQASMQELPVISSPWLSTATSQCWARHLENLMGCLSLIFRTGGGF